jgi:hypothetical protein
MGSVIAHMTFVTSGDVSEAVADARAIAGEKDVVIASPTIAQQCLNVGLLDEIHVSLAPVLLGAGIPFFANLEGAPVMLDDPAVTPGRRATHLAYRVSKKWEKPQARSSATWRWLHPRAADERRLRAYDNHNNAAAIAAGSACTIRILRLTVNPP